MGMRNGFRSAVVLTAGLLVACAADAEAEVRELFERDGFDARTIGRLAAGTPGITIT